MAQRHLSATRIGFELQGNFGMPGQTERDTEMKVSTGRRSSVPGLLVAAVMATLVAGCTSSGGNQVENTLDVGDSSPSDPNNIASAAPVDPSLPPVDEIQNPRQYCPKTVLRAGTETYDLYPKGVEKTEEGASSKLRFRSAITDIARECNSAGQMLRVRVGVRGRYLSGPSGETGSFTIPLRIAVTQGDAVLYSVLHQVPAEIREGQTNGTFAYVDNNVAFPMPDRENVVIYVGFDEGPYDTP